MNKTYTKTSACLKYFINAAPRRERERGSNCLGKVEGGEVNAEKVTESMESHYFHLFNSTQFILPILETTMQINRK